MIKREARFTVLFRHWLFSKENPHHFSSCAFELKQTQKDSIPYSDVQEHQIDALLSVKYGLRGVLWKLPDDSRGIKPFDLFYLFHTDAYIAIKFPDFFCIITVESFIASRDNSKRKSLTAEEAKKIARVVVSLKPSER